MTELVPATIRYQATAGVGEGGGEESREVTLRTGSRVPAEALDVACERLASQYADVVQQLTFGLVRAVEGQGGQRGFKVLGVGPWMLRFGAVERREQGCYALPVAGGLLAARVGGALVFRWTVSQGVERFETAVEGFFPRLMGPWGTRIGRLFYRLTQHMVHRWVMRRYHDEVGRGRERLLEGGGDVTQRVSGEQP